MTRLNESPLSASYRPISSPTGTETHLPLPPTIPPPSSSPIRHRQIVDDIIKRAEKQAKNQLSLAAKTADYKRFSEVQADLKCQVCNCTVDTFNGINNDISACGNNEKFNHNGHQLQFFVKPSANLVICSPCFNDDWQSYAPNECKTLQVTKTLTVNTTMTDLWVRRGLQEMQTKAAVLVNNHNKSSASKIHPKYQRNLKISGKTVSKTIDDRFPFLHRAPSSPKPEHLRTGSTLTAPPLSPTSPPYSPTTWTPENSNNNNNKRKHPSTVNENEKENQTNASA